MSDDLVKRLQHLGDWQAADRIEAQAARIAELEAALAIARRDAMEEAAKIAENCEYPWLEAREAEYEAADLMIGQIAIVIRAALKGGEGK